MKYLTKKTQAAVAGVAGGIVLFSIGKTVMETGVILLTFGASFGVGWLIGSEIKDRMHAKHSRTRLRNVQ